MNFCTHRLDRPICALCRVPVYVLLAEVRSPKADFLILNAFIIYMYVMMYS
jgi:hypothetical protein